MQQQNQKTSTHTANFEAGAIKRIDIKDNPLAGVGQILANRTYDESGNYLVKRKYRIS